MTRDEKISEICKISDTGERLAAYQQLVIKETTEHMREFFDELLSKENTDVQEPE